MTISNFNTAIVVNQFINPMIIATPVRDMIAAMFADQYSIPFNHGNTLVTVRFQQLPPAVVAIQPEDLVGAPPQQLNRDLITTSLSEYQQAVAITTRFLMQDELPWLAEAAERISVSLREGMDLNYYAAITGSASEYNCRYGVNGDTPTESTTQDYLEIEAALSANSAALVSQIYQGSKQFGTTPVQPAYFVAINNALSPIIAAFQGFTYTANYPIESESRAPSEYGSFNRFRFFRSPNVPVLPKASALGNDVFQSIVGGANAYCGVSLSEEGLQTLYRPPEYGNNPYGIYATIGSRVFWGASITQNTWILNVLSTGGATQVF